MSGGGETVGYGLRRHFLAICLPAFILAVTGAYVLVKEANRAHEAEVVSLQTKAEYATTLIQSQVKARIDTLLTRIAAAPSEEACTAMLSKLVRDDPFIKAAFRWCAGKGIVWSTVGASPQNQEVMRWWTQYQGTTWQSAEGQVSSIETHRDGNALHLMGWVQTAEDERCVVEFDSQVVLSSLPAIFRSKGFNRLDDHTHRATIVEVFDEEDGHIILPASSPPIGLLSGVASLSPLFHGWSLRVCWRAGDKVTAGRFWAMAIVGGCMLALLFATFVAGTVLLVRAARRAREDSLRKTDFVSTVSHELKTPLTTIRLCADLLVDGRLDGGRRVKAAQSISREATRLTRLVMNLLDFGRLEQGRRKYHLEDIRVASFLADLLVHPDGVVAATIPDQIAADLLVRADRDALRQIFTNLLDNAAKYAAEGGVPGITVSHTIYHRLQILVSDRGPGLTAEEQVRVFERFWRKDDSVTREVGGSGLGLSIARELARGMGGDLSAISRVGGGCSFVLELPEGEDSRG